MYLSRRVNCMNDKRHQTIINIPRFASVCVERIQNLQYMVYYSFGPRAETGKVHTEGVKWDGTPCSSKSPILFSPEAAA